MKALKEHIILINALAAFSFGFIWIADGKLPWTMYIHMLLSLAMYNFNDIPFIDGPRVYNAIYMYIIVLAYITCLFSGFFFSFRRKLRVVASLFLFTIFLTPLFSTSFTDGTSLTTILLFVALNSLSVVVNISMLKENKS
ncbi:hypothetical protein [Pedobacter sp. GR22-6]|uniref:hypothetical protein n=1 Tax=Pedobacter sp. GR22-6 TaxID=3127957 RepID=UPI00307F8000